jgi:hypothetical protein
MKTLILLAFILIAGCESPVNYSNKPVETDNGNAYFEINQVSEITHTVCNSYLSRDTSFNFKTLNIPTTEFYIAGYTGSLIHFSINGWSYSTSESFDLPLKLEPNKKYSIVITLD